MLLSSHTEPAWRCRFGKLFDVDDIERVLRDVGPRIRLLRKHLGVTLADLAVSTNISQSTLSRLENGQRKPTLQLLLPLADAFRVPLDDLVGAPRTGNPRTHLKPISRYGLTFIPLTNAPGGVEAFKTIIPSGALPDDPTEHTHDGFQWVYVLDGRLRVVLGEHDLVLTAGEVAEFDTRLPHALGSDDGLPVELLMLFGQHGERPRMRARSYEKGRS